MRHTEKTEPEMVNMVQSSALYKQVLLAGALAFAHSMLNIESIKIVGGALGLVTILCFASLDVLSFAK